MIAKLLLSADADVNAATPNGITPIEIAACLGYWRVLDVMCSAPSADVNTMVTKPPHAQQATVVDSLLRAITKACLACLRS